MTTRTITYTGELVVHECCNCGIDFAIPRALDQHAHRDHSVNFWCPLGHSQHYIGKTDAQIEKERAEAMARRAVNAENAARVQRERAARAERSAAAYRGQATRLRNRIAAGVCPVPGCRRSGFAQVMRHIASKHPSWAAEHEHVLKETAG